MNEESSNSEPYNPWREFIENVIAGDNYFRTSEYQELIAYIDHLLAENAALKAHKCPTGLDRFAQQVEQAEIEETGASSGIQP